VEFRGTTAVTTHCIVLLILSQIKCPHITPPEIALWLKLNLLYCLTLRRAASAQAEMARSKAYVPIVTSWWVLLCCHQCVHILLRQGIQCVGRSLLCPLFFRLENILKKHSIPLKTKLWL
jgi:hypothetical protein